MAEPAKYLFDNEFAPSGGRGHGIASGPQLYSRGKIDEIRAEGFAEGFAAGRADAEQDRERMIASALVAIAEAVPQLTADLNVEVDRLRHEAGTLALAIARKIVPALMAKCPQADLEALLGETLAHLSSEPFVAVRAHESLIDELRDHTDRIAEQNGFQGKLVLIGEAEIGPADCSIEWADGGIVRNVCDIWTQIDDSVTRHIGAQIAAENSAPAAPEPSGETGEGQ